MAEPVHIHKLEKEVRRLERLLNDRENIEDLVVRRVDDAMKHFKWSPPKMPRKDKSRKKEEKEKLKKQEELDGE